ncbi:hypothetical protein B0H15DRAFT_947551 [Mycena belliarum]|uniref:Uncharacterized protein n=1 Tax=Mycena belliarum TaxID=1033014 RepID=A0AAD6U796_9AGAR|nr:hypothetical protein B0H15DRAFT_947551 [Mycena belliae]
MSDRLASLRRREADWLNFTPQSRHTLTVAFDTSGVTACTTSLRMCISWGTYATPSRWHLVEAVKPIIDFGTALEEHDLIAMVTYNALDGEPNMRSIEVVLLEFSTGHTHPLAAYPTLHIHDVEAEMERPGISIEIVVTLSCIVPDISPQAPLDVSNTGIVFLTMNTILIPPHPQRGGPLARHTPHPTIFGGWRSPASPAQLQPARARTAPHAPLLPIQCRGEPNPRAGYTRPSRAASLPRADPALLHVNVKACGVVHRSTCSYVLVIARAPLLAALAACDPGPVVIGVSWSAWGPWCARWFDKNGLSEHYFTTTCGTGMLAIAPDKPTRPAPVRVFDFNESKVEIQQMLRGASSTPTNVSVVGAYKEEGAVERAPFAEPVFSRLPYVETVSEELFTHAVVLINNAHMIGVQFSEAMVEI